MATMEVQLVKVLTTALQQHVNWCSAQSLCSAIISRLQLVFKRIVAMLPPLLLLL
jgi:hypothetical protein